MTARPPCAIEPPNCCVKTIGFLSPCPKCGHVNCHGRYLEWEAERGIVRPHPGCAGIDECRCLDRHDPWAPDPSYPDGVAYAMRVGPLRCRVSDAGDGDWEWSVTVEADRETAWISSGFAVGKDAAMRRAEQAIRLIADGVSRALSPTSATP